MIIKIKNLKLHTKIGVFDWEKNVDREIIINAEMSTNSTKSLYSDDISDAIDYNQITSKIKNLVATNNFDLVEKMAQTIMDGILEDKRIKKCTLEIDKVGAVENLQSFAVIIEQENHHG